MERPTNEQTNAKAKTLYTPPTHTHTSYVGGIIIGMKCQLYFLEQKNQEKYFNNVAQ